jgi:hypothetical protein
MDLKKVLAELRLELERLDAAILTMERLNQAGRRRGRPPKLLSDLRRSTLSAHSGEQSDGRPRHRGTVRGSD